MRIILFLSFFILNQVVNAQTESGFQKTHDSIQSVASNNTAYIEALFKYIDNYNQGIHPLITKINNSEKSYNVDSSQLYIGQVLKITENANDLVKMYTIIYMVDQVSFQSDHALILKLLIEAKSIANRQGWLFELSTIYEQLSSCYYNCAMDNECITHIDSALYYAEKTKNLNTLGKIHYDKAVYAQLDENTDEALKNLNKAKHYFTIVNNKKMNFHTYQGFGNLYSNLNKPDSALYYLNQSLAYLNDESDCTFQLSHWINLSEIYQSKNKLNEALKYTDSILNNDLCFDLLYRTYASQLKSAILESQGKNKQALSSYKEYSYYYDSLQQTTSKVDILKIRFEYEKNLEDKKNELVNLKLSSSENTLELERTKQKKSFQIWVLVIFLLILFIIGSILVFHYRNNSLKTENIALEKTKKLKENELMQKDLDLEQQRIELDLKKRKLSASTMYITTKNEFANTIKQDLINLKKNDSIKTSDLKTIIDKLDYGINLDKDWHEFKIHFEELHHNFFERILNKHPELTKNDLKLCAYMRVNLSTKEIAQLLNVTVMAIHKRKK